MHERGHGWIVFAAIVLGVAGVMRIFDAIWAFRYHGVVPQHLEDAILAPPKTYGWVYLVVGVPDPQCARRDGPATTRNLDRRRLCRPRFHQRHLVDALLPDLVVDLWGLGVLASMH